MVQVSYRLTEFSNAHQHSKEVAMKEEEQRKKCLRADSILDQYHALLREGNDVNLVRNQLAKKFAMSEREEQKIVKPYHRVQVLYRVAKAKMTAMNFTIIEKLADTIDVSKGRAGRGTNADLPA